MTNTLALFDCSNLSAILERHEWSCFSSKCCRILWFCLTDEHPGSPSLHLSWGVYHLQTNTGVPIGPMAPSCVMWRKDAIACVFSVHRSFASSLLCNHQWGATLSKVHITSCKSYDVWKFSIRRISRTLHTHWQIHFQQSFLFKKLLCTFCRLLPTAVAG